MALTLVEAAKLSNDYLARGVVKKFVYQDPILEKLQLNQAEVKSFLIEGDIQCTKDR